MNDTWFTADTHFGHKNILVFEKEARPFDDINHMHEVMIERWNSVVKPNDTVYHLGDVAFGRNWLPILRRLNGSKRLIMGNHDTYPTADYLQYFDKLYGCKYWERCILTHMPVMRRQLDGSRWFMNVHGHTHSKVVHHPSSIWIPDELYMNVSVEQNNLTPIHADDVRKRVKAIDND